MTDYRFLEDLLDTYQSLDGFVQAMWLMGPLLFALGVLVIILHHFRARTRDVHLLHDGRLYTLRTDNLGRIYLDRELWRGGPAASEPPSSRPRVLPVLPPSM